MKNYTKFYISAFEFIVLCTNEIKLIDNAYYYQTPINCQFRNVMTFTYYELYPFTHGQNAVDVVYLQTSVYVSNGHISVLFYVSVPD